MARNLDRHPPMSKAAQSTPPLLTLAIERSTRRPGWALFRGSDCVLQHVADNEPSREPAWLPRLAAALQQAGVPLAAIDRFVAGTGPGSFSGTRASVAAAQGMALPGGRPLFGISSMAALAFARLAARAADGPGTPLAVVGDARRDRLWCAVYVLQDGKLRRRGSAGPCALSHDAPDFALARADELAALLPPEAVVVSPDWDRIGSRLAALLPAARIDAGPALPTAADVGRLYLSEPQAARSDPMPIYLHPAVAEAAK
jgi:tRNA threonylcarbamoyladenosine biosynthesis protein TsaB